jgi:hypothetical protein
LTIDSQKQNEYTVRIFLKMEASHVSTDRHTSFTRFSAHPDRPLTGQSAFRLDAWAHHQFEVKTFFTHWHGVLYSGFLALAAVLTGTFVLNIRKGWVWWQAMPVSYRLSLLGVAVFTAGGVGDMIWHLAFGIEVNIEALLSPTHLMEALGGALIVTGPIRAAWARPEEGWRSLLPALISLALLLSILTFFTSYANPLADTALPRAPVRSQRLNYSSHRG